LIGKISDAQLLAAAAAVVPGLAMIAPLGIAPLLALLAIALLVIEKRRWLVLGGSMRVLTILLAALALWGAASTAWSVIPSHSLFEAGRFVLLSAAGLVVVAASLTVDEHGRALVGRASLVGFVLALILLAVEVAGHFPIHRALSGMADRAVLLPTLDRGAIVLVLGCCPPILFLIERRLLFAAALVFMATLVALQQLISLAAVSALAVGAAAFALAWWWPRAVALLLAGGFVVLTAGLPFCAPTRDTVIWLGEAAPWLRTSSQHRLIIWRFTSDRVADRPLLGWGMDAARAIPGGKTSVRDYMSLPDQLLLEGAVMPLHPHDAILQWSLELGIGGQLLGGAIVVCILWIAGFAATSSYATRAVGIAAIAAALPPLLLSFGVWQAWWQSTLWLVAALIVATGGGAPTAERRLKSRRRTITDGSVEVHPIHFMKFII
jgi:exopolysaccharide production protein ExoQ